MEATGDLSLALSPHEISYFLQLPDPAARTLVPAGCSFSVDHESGALGEYSLDFESGPSSVRQDEVPPR
jgi:hypothetical protein